MTRVRLKGAILAATLLCSCSTPGDEGEKPSTDALGELPEFFGLYVVADGKFHGVDVSVSTLNPETQAVAVSRTERDFKAGGGAPSVLPLFPGTLNLLVFVKSLPLEVAEQLELRKLSFVRQMIINEQMPGYRQAFAPNSWVAATDFGYNGVGETPVQLLYKPVQGQNEMVLAVPSSPLDPGLYALRAGDDDYLFAVPPLESAHSTRCIDASNPGGGGFGKWETRLCGESAIPATTGDTLSAGVEPQSPIISLGSFSDGSVQLELWRDNSANEQVLGRVSIFSQDVSQTPKIGELANIKGTGISGAFSFTSSLRGEDISFDGSINGDAIQGRLRSTLYEEPFELDLRRGEKQYEKNYPSRSDWTKEMAEQLACCGPAASGDSR